MNPLSILTGAPLWVWPLLALLIWLGWRDRRPRRAARWTQLILPLVALALARPRILAAPDLVPALALYGAAMLAAAPFGLRLGRKALLKREADPAVVALAGSNFTLVMGLSIFLVNYALGVLVARHPEWVGDRLFGFGPVAIGGLLTGLVVARQAMILIRHRAQAKGG